MLIKAGLSPSALTCGAILFTLTAPSGCFNDAGGDSSSDGSISTAGPTVTATASGTSEGVTSDEASTGATGTGGTTTAGPPLCDVDNPCPDGETCLLEAGCCPSDQVCGAACCGGDEPCSFNQCIAPGAACDSSESCPEGEYCSFLFEPDDGGMCANVLSEGFCLPKPPICPPGEDGVGDMGEITCVQQCELVPEQFAFEPVAKYTWQPASGNAGAGVHMTPVVVQLDDDDCDGKVTANDTPEIVFNENSTSSLHVASVVDGQLVIKAIAPVPTYFRSGIAAGDLDGDGVAELVTCMYVDPYDGTPQSQGTIAFKYDNGALVPFWTNTDVLCGEEYPAIADPDQTGEPKVLVRLALLDGATGELDAVLNADPGSTSVWTHQDDPLAGHIGGFYDIDDDGALEIVEGIRAYRADGTPLWDFTGMRPFGFHGVGDLDGDGAPEVVVVSPRAPHRLSVLRWDPQSDSVELVRDDVDINLGQSSGQVCGLPEWGEWGGGAPTIGDFNGDGAADVGVAGALGYTVFDGKKLVDGEQAELWFVPTKDCSSASTGSSLFDFNGDGRAEVVYNDEVYLRVFDGITGDVLLQQCSTSGTVRENPVIADVDGDGAADIVSVSNVSIYDSCDGGYQRGLTVWGSANGSWTRTRRVWNQHTYHITNLVTVARRRSVSAASSARPSSRASRLK